MTRRSSNLNSATAPFAVVTGIVVVLLAFSGLQSIRETVQSPEVDSGIDIGGNLENQIREKMRADSGPYGGVSDAFAMLFKAVGTGGMCNFEQHSDDSIAIQAAWQEVESTVPEGELEQSVRPDQQKLKWFLGFLEQRTHIRAPQWWAEALLDARAYRRGHVRMGESHEQPYHPAGLEGVRSPIDTSLKREWGRIMLRVGNESVPIPKDLFEHSSTKRGLERFGNVSALTTRQRCYLAIHDDVGYPFDLHCIDRASGTVRWKARVWGTWWGNATGVHEGWVAVREQNDQIVLFGKTSVGFYVEAFHAKDGHNALRFSNLYLAFARSRNE